MFKNYIKIAFKVLLRRKFITFISLFGIGLTLAMLMVYVAFFDNVFGKMPPETKHDRTLGVFTIKFYRENNGSSESLPSYKFLKDYIKIQTLPHVEKASVFSVFDKVEAVHDDKMLKVSQKRTDGSFWKILDFSFIEGRPFSEEEEKNADYVAVINKSTRNKFFGNDDALGETITIDSQRYRVIGVVEDVSAFRLIPYADVWVPVTTSKTNAYLDDALFGSFSGIALADKKRNIPLIKEEFQARLNSMDYPATESFTSANGAIETFFSFLARKCFNENGESKEENLSNTLMMTLLISLMLLFMILPAINLININLSRILERSSEIGVRKAFGASSWVLVGQFVVENIILTLIGGVIGLGLSIVVLNTFNNMQILPYADLHFNGRIFLYGFIITILFGVFSGVYPAWKMSRLHPVDALRDRN